MSRPLSRLKWNLLRLLLLLHRRETPTQSQPHYNLDTVITFIKDPLWSNVTLKSRIFKDVQKRCRACRRRGTSSHPVKELAINKDHTIYVQLLSTAWWKHITWRCDPSTLSCHSTLSTLSDLQGGDAVPGGRRASFDHNRPCSRWKSVAGNWGFPRQALKICWTWPAARPKGFVRYTEERLPRQRVGGKLTWAHRGRKVPPSLPEEQLWGPRICRSVLMWFKATGFTFYILDWKSINRWFCLTSSPWNLQTMHT